MMEHTPSYLLQKYFQIYVHWTVLFHIHVLKLPYHLGYIIRNNLYKKGENAPHTDLLSRSPNNEVTPIKNVENAICTRAVDLPLTQLEIAKAYKQRPDLSGVLPNAYQGRPTEASSKLEFNFNCKLELCNKFELITW